MKPIYIRMKAFGSYQEETVDFTKADHGLFLITGDTGSGKTTIFDAITYALYGKTSGGNRDGEMMISQYAQPGSRTEVELGFSYGKDIYKILRSPEQPNWKRNKDTGLYEPLKTPQNARVELTMPDGSVFAGKKAETDRKIAEIIGLDVRQFTQIVMLAQGDFLKLLHASSEERKEIFARIFDTRVYYLISKEIENRTREKKNALLTNRDDIIKELDRVNCAPESAFAAEWAESERFREDDSAGLLALVEQITEECSRFQEELEEKSRENAGNLEALRLVINAAQERNAAFAELEKTLQEQKKLEEQKPEQERRQQRISCGERALAVNEHYRISGQKRAELARSRNLTAELAGELELLKKDIKSVLGQRDTARENWEREEGPLTAAQNSLMLQLPVYEDIRKKTEEITRLERQMQEEEKNQKLHREFILSQAAVLRRELKEGEPCPVCGSIHHSLTADSSEAGKKAEITAEVPGLSIQEFLEEIGKTKRELESAAAVRETLIRGLMYPTLREAKSELTRISGQLKSLKEEKDRTEKVCEQRQERIRQCEARKAAEEEACRRLETEVKEAEAQYARALQEQHFADTTEYEAARMDLAQIRQEQEKLRLYQEQLIRTQTAAEKLTEQTRGKEPADLRALQQREQELLTAARELRQKELSYHTRLENNRAACKAAGHLYEVRGALLREYQILSNLDQTVNGRMSRKHVNFQTYIQRRFFRQVIEYANNRLNVMSDSQFLLQCRELKDLGTQGEVGLDLDVYSVVNDQVRDVKTLSGGESFMAALAMALGMSDIVQNQAGRIRIDTMFIDEGFGSLSEETRNQAVGMLQELSEGSRLVGIISHVSELKAQVETKLAVKKDDKGSHAVWEIG